MAVAVAEIDGDRDFDGEREADPLGEMLGVAVALLARDVEADLVALSLPLPLREPVLEGDLLAEADALRLTALAERDAVNDSDCVLLRDAEPDADRLPEGALLGVTLGDCVVEAERLGVSDVEAPKETLGDALGESEGERELVAVADKGTQASSVTPPAAPMPVVVGEPPT